MNGRYKRRRPWRIPGASGSIWRGYSFWLGVITQSTQSYIYLVADGSAMYEAC